MSPTEFDLRAALRDGEGDGVNPDSVIATGRRQRAQRRARLMSTAAVVVLVAAAGIGGAVLWNHSSSQTSTASGDKAASATGGQAVPKAAGGASERRPEPSAAAGALAGGAVMCPDSLPRHLLPGGGSPGQFGADGPMFAQPVVAVVVCSYGTPLNALGNSPTSVPARLQLTGKHAKELADSLEHAATTKSTTACASVRDENQRELAIIGITSHGKALPTVTTTLSDPPCGVRVTNGTALRYGWTAPKDLQQVLLALTPGTGKLSGSLPRIAPSGRNHGSPIQS